MIKAAPLYYAAITSTFLSFTLQASPDNPNDFLNLNLEDLLNINVITASKYEEKFVDSSSNIEIFTAKQINDRGYKSIEDLLRNLAGVDLHEYSTVGEYNVTVMRGATNNNKFIILKDGIRISTPAGETNAISQNYPLYMAKRVEVLTGSAAVTYGADAFSAVINIITHDNNNLLANEDKGQISVSLGEDHYFNSHLQYSHLFGNGIYVNLGVQGHYSQELEFDKQYPELYTDTNKQYDFKNTEEFQFFADAKINEHFALGAFHSKITYSSDFVAKPFFSSFDQAITEESNTSIYTKFDYEISDNLHSNTLFTYQHFSLGNSTNFNNLFTGYERRYKYGRTARYSLNQDFTYQPSSEHLLSAGFVYDYFDVIPRGPDLPSPYDVEKKPNEQNFFYPNTELEISFFQQRDENVGVYLQDNWRIDEKWRQVTGVRYDHHTLFGDTINPRSTTIYKANQYNVFKLIYAHSFLAPPSNQAFNSFGTFTGEQNAQGQWLSTPHVPFRVPNENLKPETLQSIEFNYQHWFNDHSNIKIAPFYSEIDDVISMTADELAQQKIAGALLAETNSFKNIGQLTTYGVDITANLSMEFSKASVEYWLATSYLNGDLTEQYEVTDLPMISHFKVKTGLTVNYQDDGQRIYVISPILRWASGPHRNNLDFGSSDTRSELPSYYVIDLHGEVKFSASMSAKLTINNLLDNKHFHASVDNPTYAFDKAPQLGRLIFATLTYNF
ncbi:MAG: TonB-dependent receptor [Colwellia sp.]|nr:TonB-dependent receptor [Colwellia sp.]MCW8865720.1 TonB-dependent receptor [Colwellia sp.]MCW9080242.1 TonB-dependent receptor [Colwellia sp.]